MDQYRASPFRHIEHRPRSVEDLGSVRLLQIPLTPDAHATVATERAEIECSVLGIPALLNVERILNTALESEDYIFLLRAKDSDTVITGTCIFSSFFNTLLAKTSVLRNQGEKKGTQELPKGSGVILWKKLAEFIQDSAQKRNAPILHDVERFLSLAEIPMSEEKWNEIFVPLLTEHGYTALAEDRWEKRYYPETKE